MTIHILKSGSSLSRDRQVSTGWLKQTFHLHCPHPPEPQASRDRVAALKSEGDRLNFHCFKGTTKLLPTRVTTGLEQTHLLEFLESQREGGSCEGSKDLSSHDSSASHLLHCPSAAKTTSITSSVEYELWEMHCPFSCLAVDPSV